MLQVDTIILRPIVSEKAAAASSGLNQYTFEVAGSANAVTVKKAIEQQYKVDVVSVNTLNVRPKLKRSRTRANSYGQVSGYKKAIVRLAAGQSINLA